MLSSNFLNLFPTFGKFLQKWIQTHWRSLLILIFGIYLPLQIFILLAAQVWISETGLQWDVPILLALHNTTQADLDAFAHIVTRFGTRWGVFPASVGLMALFFTLKRWRSLLYLFMTVFGCLVINRSAKELWHRARPHLWDSPFPPEPEYAFPSGHAMLSMAFVAALVVLTWSTRWRWLAIALGSLFVITIAWTRLYLGVHYPSDIVAGWMLSIAWAIAISVLVKPHAISFGAYQEIPTDRNQR